jgi:hypothetical protein
MDARMRYSPGFRAGVDGDQFQAGDARLVEKTAEHGVHIPGLDFRPNT